MPIILKNARGQMGTLLKQKIKDIQVKDNVYIYHTWNIEDKSYRKQEMEYEKFKSFVIENKQNKIIFISTSSQKECEYVKFKQLSESYLIQNNNNSFALRFPTLIGKGVFQDFKSNTKKPYGEMNIMKLENACDLIIDFLKYDGNLKIITFEGHKIHSDLVYDMVRI